jgi:PIN domain nuclease of toxin-antitoxin system
MRVLIDTHAFIWELLADHRSSRKAIEVMRSKEYDLVFSIVSLWEVSIKIKLGKLNAIGSSVAYIREQMNEYGMELLPLQYEHLLQLENLPLHHGEPFDRLLIAQAITEGLPILTHDQHFPKYPVKLIW